MFILIEYEKTWEKGEYNWIREYSPAVTPQPSQTRVSQQFSDLGTQPSHSENVKQTDLLFFACTMQAGGNANSLLNSLNNGVKTSASRRPYKHNFGKHSFWKSLHRWAGNMSNSGSTGSRSFLQISFSLLACRTYRLRVFFTVPRVYLIQVLPSHGSSNDHNSSEVFSQLTPLNAKNKILKIGWEHRARWTEGVCREEGRNLRRRSRISQVGQDECGKSIWVRGRWGPDGKKVHTLNNKAEGTSFTGHCEDLGAGAMGQVI